MTPVNWLLLSDLEFQLQSSYRLVSGTIERSCRDQHDGELSIASWDSTMTIVSSEVLIDRLGFKKRKLVSTIEVPPQGDVLVVLYGSSPFNS